MNKTTILEHPITILKIELDFLQNMQIVGSIELDKIKALKIEGINEALKVLEIVDVKEDNNELYDNMP